MQAFYQCNLCKKKFPMYAKYGGRIPQKENLKPVCNIIIHDFNVGHLPTRCFKCDDKIVDKMEKILNKDRNKIHLTEKVFDKILGGDMDNPFISYKEWAKLEQAKIDAHKYKCTKCNRGFDELKLTFSKNIRVLAGTYAILRTNNTCLECIDEITEDLKGEIK